MILHKTLKTTQKSNISFWFLITRMESWIPANQAPKMSHMKILELCSIADNVTSTAVISVEIGKSQLFHSACQLLTLNFAESYTGGIVTQEVVTVL